MWLDMAVTLARRGIWWALGLRWTCAPQPEMVPVAAVLEHSQQRQASQALEKRSALLHGGDNIVAGVGSHAQRDCKFANGYFRPTTLEQPEICHYVRRILDQGSAPCF